MSKRSASKRKKSRSHRSQRRLSAESLEDRRMMATLTVNSLADSGAGSLREVIATSNSNGESDTILFDASVAGGSVSLTTGELTIGEFGYETTLDGSGVTIDAGGLSRVINVDDGNGYAQSATVNLSNLTITGGAAPIGSAGGGILSAENLTIENVTITGNTAQFGGGIANANGILTMSNSGIADNSATFAGGGAYFTGDDSDIDIIDCEIYGNTVGLNNNGAFVSTGGGIHSNGLFEISNSTVSNNTATTAGTLYDLGGVGGGVYMSSSGRDTPPPEPPECTFGGEPSMDLLTGRYLCEWAGNVTFNNNNASSSGGAVWLDGEIGVKIDGSTFLNNISTNGTGGSVVFAGIALRINDSTISGGVAERGGGIYAGSEGRVAVSGSTIENNSARLFGGGISLAPGADVILDGTTVQNNDVYDTSVLPWGGGAFLAGAAGADVSRLNIANGSVIQSNTAPGRGGGIGSAPFGTNSSGQPGVTWFQVDVDESTIRNNSAGDDGGGIHIARGGMTNITNGSVLSGNTAVDSGGAVSSFGYGCGNGGCFEGDGNGFTYINVRDSLVDGNTAARGQIAGGQYVDATNMFQGGPAIVTIERSAVINAIEGGAIDVTQSNLILNESTLSGNSSSRDGAGFGLFVFEGYGGTMDYSAEVENSTIAFNSSAAYAGGIYASNYGGIGLQGSIVAANTGASGDVFDNSNASNTAVDSIIGNNAGSGFAADGILIGDAGSPVDPVLNSSLSIWNTHEPMAGSPALEANLSNTSPVDQRGAARPWDANADALGGVADIGAHEFLAPPHPRASIHGQVFGPALLSPRSTETERLGEQDQYALGNSEPTTLSSGLDAYLNDQGFTVTCYDATGINQFFADSFLGLPNGIVEAQVTIGARPIGDGLAFNDTIEFAVRLPTGEILPDARWSSHFGSGNQRSSLVDQRWIRSNFPDGADFTIDVYNPELLAAMRTEGVLDVVVQDDTAIDYMELCYTSIKPVPLNGREVTLIDSAGNSVSQQTMSMDINGDGNIDASEQGLFWFDQLAGGPYELSTSGATELGVNLRPGQRLVGVELTTTGINYYLNACSTTRYDDPWVPFEQSHPAGTGVGFEGLSGPIAPDVFTDSHGLTFANLQGSVGVAMEGDQGTIQTLDFYDETYAPDGRPVLTTFPNDVDPLALIWDEIEPSGTSPVSVGSFIGTGSEGTIETVTISIFDTQDELITSFQQSVGLNENPQNREGFWSYQTDGTKIGRVTILNDNPVPSGNALIVDDIRWATTEDYQNLFLQRAGEFEAFFDGESPEVVSAFDELDAAGVSISGIDCDGTPCDVEIVGVLEDTAQSGELDGYDGSYEPDLSNVILTRPAATPTPVGNEGAIRIDFADRAQKVGGLVAMDLATTCDAERGCLTVAAFDANGNQILEENFDAFRYSNLDKSELFGNLDAGDFLIDYVELYPLDSNGIRDPYAELILDNLTFTATPIDSGDPDFDGDGSLDCADIDALTENIASGTNDPAFDLTGDGVVNPDDRDAWLAAAGEANLGPGKAYLLGDANLDGVVDVSDFGIWNANKFTANAAWCSGDWTADGVVDVSDFGIWNANKFTSADQATVMQPRETFDGGNAAVEPSVIQIDGPSLYATVHDLPERQHLPQASRDYVTQSVRSNVEDEADESVSLSVLDRVFAGV